MPMTREEHEAILAKLLDAELPHSERTEMLQSLRADYGSVLNEFEEFTKNTEKLQKDNADLVLSNSKLFRQIGIQDDPNMLKQEEEKQLSETITLEALENSPN